MEGRHRAVKYDNEEVEEEEVDNTEELNIHHARQSSTSSCLFAGCTE